jgi:hypothetical protein
MHKRFAPDQSDPHGTKLANFPYPFFQIVEAGMRPAIVVLGAIGTIEITTIRHVKTALQRSAIEKTLPRFQDVVAGKFSADFVEQLHTIDPERFSLGLVTRDAIHSEPSFSHVQANGTMSGTSGTAATYKANAHAQKLRDGPQG